MGGRVAFGTFSYAGELSITVIADPDAVPDLETLRSVLQDALAGFLAAGTPGDPD